MSWNRTEVSNFYTSWSSLLTFSTVCTTQFNSFTFNLGQRIKIKKIKLCFVNPKKSLLLCQHCFIWMVTPQGLSSNYEVTGTKYLSWSRGGGKEMSTWLLSWLCNFYFTYRILDKLKSSSAESQVQIGRLTEDLVQAKVHKVMIQWGLMKSKLMMKHFNNVRIFIEIWDASYWWLMYYSIKTMILSSALFLEGKNYNEKHSREFG